MLEIPDVNTFIYNLESFFCCHVGITNIKEASDKSRFEQWKMVNDTPQDSIAGGHEMKLGLHNYIAIMPILRVVSNLVINQILYKNATLHKITEVHTEWFSVCPNITSKFCTIAIFKRIVKQKMIQIKVVGMSMIFYCTTLHKRKSSVV
jgi:hypothetical protein